MKKRLLPALILVFCLILPLAARATEPEIWAVAKVATIPACWNPLGEQTEETALILSLTGDRLYVLSPDGQELTPSLAVGMPEDVTAQYAGSRGIPESARRGYAFAIGLEPDARWEDGTPITAGDWLFTMHQMIHREVLPLALARLEDYYAGLEKPTQNIVSLREAGFSSVEEAEEAGRTEFYVDIGHFWGLDAGWRPVSDRARLKDAAIPSGVTEMYVSATYLYQRYLRTGAAQSVFQTEFVGVSAEPEYVTLEDVGILREDTHRLVLILEEPTTAEGLALALTGLFPLRENLFGEDYATSEETYSACGPYRITDTGAGELILEPNGYWLGKVSAPEADWIRITAHIGA